MARALKVVEDEEFGPEMRKLGPQEQMFVCCLFQGLMSCTKAADLAGYTAVTRAALRVQAHRLLHRKDIAAAVIEESKRRTVFLMPRAQRALADLVESPQHPDHFKAVRLVREESGLSPVVRKAIDVNVQFSNMGQDEKMKHIIAFAERKGIDPKTLLGFDPHIKDAEFEEVIDNTPLDPELAELR
jgi:hypothetical protein